MFFACNGENQEGILYIHLKGHIYKWNGFLKTVSYYKVIYCAYCVCRYSESKEMFLSGLCKTGTSVYFLEGKICENPFWSLGAAAFCVKSARGHYCFY